MIDFLKRLALGCAVALVFFVLVEVILLSAGVVPLYERADPYVGFAGYSPLFVERTSDSGERVFETAPAKLRWFNAQRFPVRKREGVTRIFCLGGSTTYGRPYDDGTSFCGWLRAFLPAVDPGRRWEVVNAGGVSYASYRVVRVMEALAEQQPDLFIVYTGHNEFLEKRTYAKLLNTPQFVRDLGSVASRLRLYSVLSDVTYDRGDVLSSEVQAVLDRTVGPEDYHRDDELRDAVLEHFRTSLERMTHVSERAGAELIFVTPASNIGDFSPFKSEPSDGMSAEQVRLVRSMKVSAAAALDEARPELAVDLAAQALALDPRDADLLYLRARALRDLGRVDEARRSFMTARDEDIAPLRALTPMPGIVAEVARAQGAGLVDFARMVDEMSPDGIPGAQLFLDHVHPTIEGNRMLALALVDEMIGQEIVSPAETWEAEAIAAITAEVEGSLDEKSRALALRSLTNVLTWAGKHEEAVRLDPGNAAMRMGYGILLSDQGRKEEALRELDVAISLDETQPGVHYELAVVLKDLGRVEEAEAAYRRALEQDPSNADAYNNLGVILAQRGDIPGAAQLFAAALEADPGHRNAAENLAMARAAMAP